MSSDQISEKEKKATCDVFFEWLENDQMVLFKRMTQIMRNRGKPEAVIKLVERDFKRFMYAVRELYLEHGHFEGWGIEDISRKVGDNEWVIICKLWVNQSPGSEIKSRSDLISDREWPKFQADVDRKLKGTDVQ